MFYQGNSDPLFKMTKARADLISIQPFFGTLALRLRLVETEIVPVMGTDGSSLFYNPSAIKDMPQQQVMGVVAHEVLHCAFQHMFRRRHRIHDKWNKAADYVINAILLQEGFSLPKSRLFNSKYSNMPAEEVYEKLPNDPPGSGSNPDWDFGSSLDPAAPNPDTGEGKTPSEVSSLAKDWEIATKQAAHIAKQQGKLPGDLASIIEDLLAPQIPWREQLWRFFSQRKPDRITWNRPNRRLAHTGIYLPTKRFVPTGDIVVAVDTSGSVSEDELRHFSSEFNEIHRTLQPRKTYVLDIDTKIHSIKEYTQYDAPTFEYKGRGGTCFEPVFEWVETEHIQLDALVYLTDGYATFPTNPPPYPVLWVITNHDVKPPWGEHLILEV